MILHWSESVDEPSSDITAHSDAEGGNHEHDDMPFFGTSDSEANSTTSQTLQSSDVVQDESISAADEPDADIESPSVETMEIQTNEADGTHEDASDSGHRYNVIAQAREIAHQFYLIRQNPWIHHINWIGCGVLHKIATPPSVSLTVLMIGAKGFSRETELRQALLLQEAMKFVDPIIYFGPAEPLISLKGSALEKAVIGLCRKYYSCFGLAKSDVYKEGEDRPMFDHMSIVEPISDRFIFNGWYWNRGVPLRRDYVQLDRSLQKMRRKSKRVEARHERLPKKSPLLQYMTSDDPADVMPDHRELEELIVDVSARVQQTVPTEEINKASRNWLRGESSQPACKNLFRRWDDIVFGTLLSASHQAFRSFPSLSKPFLRR